MIKIFKWLLYIGLVLPLLYSILDLIYKINLPIIEVYYIGKTTRKVFSVFIITLILLGIYMFKTQKKIIYIFFVVYYFLFLIVLNCYWTSI